MRAQAYREKIETERYTLYLGDCLKADDLSCDACLTDPPYGINHASSRGASWQDTCIAGDCDTSVRDVCLSMLSDDLPVAAFGIWKTPPILNTRGVLVWDKGPAFGMGDLAFPWKPSWEMIYIRGQGWIGKRDEGVMRGPVVVSWESKGRVHPHEKPAWIFDRLLRKLPSAEIILDPFMGSGTSGVAAMRQGRRFVGWEIDPAYFKIAANRISKAAEEPALFKIAREAEQSELFER